MGEITKQIRCACVLAADMLIRIRQRVAFGHYDRVVTSGTSDRVRRWLTVGICENGPVRTQVQLIYLIFVPVSGRRP